MRSRVPTILIAAVAGLMLSSGPTISRAAPDDAAGRRQSLAARARQAFLSEQRRALAEIRGSVENTPTRRPDELVRMTLTPDGRLTATTTPEGLRQSKTDQAIAVTGGGWMRIESIGPVPSASDTFRFRLMMLDEAAARATLLELYAAPGRLMLSFTIQTAQDALVAQLVERGSDELDFENPSSAAMTLQRVIERIRPADAERADLEEGLSGIEADSTADLFAARHAESLAIFGEALTQLRAMPLLAGALTEAQVRQICLGDAPPTPAVTAALDTLLADLRSHGGTTLTPAREALRKLDASAISALSHRSRVGWPAELCVNVDTLLADLLPLPEPRAVDVRRSADRMLDLLYWPDESVRRLALARVERLAGRKLPIDVAQDPYAQATQIEAVRLVIGERR